MFDELGPRLAKGIPLLQHSQCFRHPLEPVLMMQQHAHLRMLAYDRSPIGGRVRDLACRGYRMHVGYLVGEPEPSSGIRNTVISAGRDQRRRAVSLCMVPTFTASDVTATMIGAAPSRAIQGYRDAVMRRHRIVAFVGRHGDVYRHRTNQHEHDDECYEQVGAGRLRHSRALIAAPDTTKNTGMRNP